MSKVLLYRVAISDHKSRHKYMTPVKTVEVSYVEGRENEVHFLRRALKVAGKSPDEALTGRYTFEWTVVREIEHL